MRILRYIYICLILTVMAACSESTPDESAMSGNILLGATVGELHVSSRAEADPQESTGERKFIAEPWKKTDTELKADVWFRKSDGEYGPSPESDATQLPVRTTVTFSSSLNWQASVKDKDNKDLNYPGDGKEVSCIGMYPASTPASKWSSTDNKTFSAEINGADDLMFAPEISGSWSNRFTEQRYEHLLAWIKINVCASSHEAMKTWGKITQISIDSYSSVTVNPGTKIPGNSDTEMNIGNNGYCIFKNPQWIKTIKIKEDPEGDTGFILESTTFKEVGSVLCFPVRHEGSTGNPEDNKNYWVKIKIESEGREPQTVPLMLNTITQTTGEDGIYKETVENVKEAKVLMGKCFVFSLYFTPYTVVIKGICTLNPWTEQNEDITLRLL